MGNEMGNSSVAGALEQDNRGVDGIDKPTEVSKVSADKTEQEDKSLDVNLGDNASKERDAAEGSDNSVMQQTCQDREERTSLMANATVQPMEPSPTESEDFKSCQQEENLVIAAQVKGSIQQIESEESSERSDAKEERGDLVNEVAKMTNGEGIELQDNFVADSSIGPTEKIETEDDTVQMLNGVVECNSISEFDRSPEDEPKDESEKYDLSAETETESSEIVIQLNNNEGGQGQNEKPIDLSEENESRELDLDDAMESLYLEAIDSEMRTVCFEANKKETEIPPETASDRYYGSATVNLEEDSKESGEQRLKILPQNGEEKELEKSAPEVKPPEISLITEELEDESDMIEISGSLADFVISSPSQENETENVSDVAGDAIKFPELDESEGGEPRNASSSLSDSAADIDVEALEEKQNSDTAIKVAEDTEGLAPNYPKEAQHDNTLLTEDQERQTEQPISACTEVIELSQELEQKFVIMESQTCGNPETCLPDFPEENQERTENFEFNPRPNPAEKCDQAANSKDQPLELEAQIDVIQCVGESNSIMDSEKPKTGTEPERENLETERISFDFQNPMPETRFSDVESTKADFFPGQTFPQTVAMKTETSGLEGSHPDEDELVTKVPIAETKVLTPRASKEERREELTNEKSSSMCNDSGIKRSVSVRSKPPNQKEVDTVVGLLQRQQTAAVNKTVGDTWKSPDKKIVATSPRVRGKQRSRSSVFSSCMCCTTVIQ